MASPQILLISNGYENGCFLQHCKDEILTFLRGRKHVLFVPHAWEERRHTEYFDLFQSAVAPWGLHPICLSNTSSDAGLDKYEAIFVGGGNTFRLLASLYRLDVMRLLKKLVVQDGVPYIGVSAGAMLATPAILTTSSKPVAYPPSFRGLGAVPFLLVPHYPTTSYPHQQSDVSSSSNTTDKDITEVITLPGVNSIVGLPDGCVLKYTDGNVTVQSSRENTLAILFQKDVNKTTIQNNKVISFMEFQTEPIPDEVAGPCIM